MQSELSVLIEYNKEFWIKTAQTNFVCSNKVSKLFIYLCCSKDDVYVLYDFSNFHTCGFHKYGAQVINMYRSANLHIPYNKKSFCTAAEKVCLQHYCYWTEKRFCIIRNLVDKINLLRYDCVSCSSDDELYD